MGCADVPARLLEQQAEALLPVEAVDPLVIDPPAPRRSRM